MRIIASSGDIPTIRSAASQVAPQDAPRTTSILEMRPSLMSTMYSGAPNRSPYSPRQTCLGSEHQVGGVRTPLILLFLPEATTGIPFLRQIKERSWERSGCLRKSRTRSARMSSGRNGAVSSITGGKAWSMSNYSRIVLSPRFSPSRCCSAEKSLFFEESQPSVTPEAVSSFQGYDSIV